MPDLIRLLPDTVANQIAAGEVIQRPASAVKELLENAIDAGSSRIDLFVKDSGKTLIQVTDNGCGMSATDARMAFERHATSKIRSADDLFHIRTMGFRGEALASIAAVAQVELKTRRHDDEVGTRLQIDGNEILSQEPVTAAAGSTFYIRNLFFNVPARRNFLKSNPVEARHIIDEFERVALAQPSIAFSLNQNGLEVFKLPASNLRQRIVNLYGQPYNERLVPVQEETTLLNIQGFVGKPEFSRKTRGEQYFFVNRRFIKDGYLHHAVTNAFESLLPREAYASYWLYLEIDPGKIDVNIHPTKTEIKFEDERSVYAIVRAAVKRALGQYSVTPSLDFERETSFDVPSGMNHRPPVLPGITVNTGYNPFKESGDRIRTSGWEKMYEGLDQVAVAQASLIPDPAELFPDAAATSETASDEMAPATGEIISIDSRYLAFPMHGGLCLVDQQAAHERILFEELLNRPEEAIQGSQQELFPVHLQFRTADAELLAQHLDDLRRFGFMLESFGGSAFVLQATPVGVERGTEQSVLEHILENLKHFHPDPTEPVREQLARALARSLAIPAGRELTPVKRQELIEALFRCSNPGMGIDGKPCIVRISQEELRGRFR
ncbi:MAG TPA: DNA mismatch repair endonuclease MutL [Bacteroidia bacterium]|nr:DNA mismatch repair endonuclease MutL [Bacteroidia bacterium]